MQVVPSMVCPLDPLLSGSIIQALEEHHLIQQDVFIRAVTLEPCIGKRFS